MSNEIISTMNMMGHGSQYAFGVLKVCGAVTGIYKFMNLVPHELSVCALRSAFQLCVFHTCVHARKSLSFSNWFVLKK